MQHDVADHTTHQGQPAHARPLRLIQQCSNQRRGESRAINGYLVRHIDLSRRSEGPIKDKSRKRTHTTACPRMITQRQRTGQRPRKKRPKGNQSHHQCMEPMQP